MFKDFYEEIHAHIADRIENKIFALNIDESVCYSIGKYSKKNVGAIITSYYDAFKFLSICGSDGKILYIPINAFDDREGLSIFETAKLVRDIRTFADVKICGLITSGCLNSHHPSYEKLCNIYGCLKDNVDSISLGGSFWLGTDVNIPSFISDIRIGEYMLFGTIPYCSDSKKNGLNGIEIEARIIGVYPERSQLILDCGYTHANLMESRILNNNDLKFIDSSSEYTIMSGQNVSDYCIGDTVVFIPNYKSLVTLKSVEHEYR
jgi:hypothetical protein